MYGRIIEVSMGFATPYIAFPFSSFSSYCLITISSIIQRMEYFSGSAGSRGFSGAALSRGLIRSRDPRFPGGRANSSADKSEAYEWPLLTSVTIIRIQRSSSLINRGESSR
jgi:hypothetical protein